MSLKTNLALEGEELRFQMPKADDIILPENLSTIEFSLKAVPQKPDLTSYGEVPDLIGLLQETAEGKLLEAGFKVGEVLKKESSAPQGTVIAQLPSEGSLAEPGAVVDLVISGASPVEVPNLLGLELESAKQALEKTRLRLGGVREQPSEGKAGVVLAQSLRAGSKVDADSSLVLVVSSDVLSVPNLLGLELESAKQVLEKSLLQLGGVREQPSEGKAGVVLAQSLKPGTEAKVNSRIMLVVSTEIKKETPEIIVSEKPKRTFPETIVKPASGTVVKPVAETTVKPVAETTVKPVAETTVKPVAETTVKPSTEEPSRVSTEPAFKAPVETPAKVSTEIPARVSADTLPKRVVSEPSKPEVRTIPNVVSQPLEKAVSLLGGEGLKVGKVSELLARSPAGTVISQSPRAGSIANPLIPVDLVVSKGMPAINLDRSSISGISSLRR
ncbi:PASTA domain-containing protein [Methanosarcina sp. KYL-1]|nr:PASTA domain-containing protein [Methanosarcina sp. KYL-1]